ncbi:hypothetical protein PN823_004466 [Enterobacter hormaechei]|nr:hypothetical protein [Enterobacter hormaechei]
MITFLMSWLVACILGVIGCWIFRAKGAGFVLGFGLVGFFWLLVWLYPHPLALGPFIVS